MDGKENNQQDQPGNQADFPPISAGDETLDGGCGGSGQEVIPKIKDYEIIQKLGEGGMAIVYLANQLRPIKRSVALKVIKPGMDSKQVVARFEAERQALALLKHPNIAHMYNAGTTELGRPYFVMEYVEGVPITDFCDQSQLSIEDRLKLFIQVCEAVQHAHQKGIIHRDIKPSNIIVSVEDGNATPKVIDFGIAKAINQQLVEHTIFTQHGQLIGTPEYMSPEQADLKEKDIDTRTDIYSLGIVLYELLAGTLPFDSETLREGGFAEIQRIIRDEEPPHPSAKLSSLGADATKIAQRRKTQLSTLVKSLHVELEWIPLMAIRKDRDQRYKTASGLAEDVQNYLDGKPLVAGPQSIIYKARKFVKANKILVTAAVVFLIFLPATIGTSTFAVRAVKAEGVALKQKEIAVQERNRAVKAEAAKKEALKELYTNYINMIKAASTSNNPKFAREMLDFCPVDLRGWEWYRLSDILDKSIITSPDHWGSLASAVAIPDITLGGDMGSILSIAFSPDGKRIVSGSQDGTLKAWDLETNEDIVMRGHSGAVLSVAYSPDGRQIVSGSQDRRVGIWDSGTGKQLRTLTGHSEALSTVAFSPDHRMLASVSQDGTIRIWDAMSGSELFAFSGRLVCFNPDGKSLATVDEDNTVSIRDRLTGVEMSSLSSSHQSDILSIAFSPDGKRIVSGSQDGTLKIWDLETLKEGIIMHGHTGPVFSVAFSSKGRIVSGSQDGTLKIWDATTGKEMITLKGYLDSESKVAFSPDGKRIALGSSDGTVKIWYSAIPEEVRKASD